MHFTESKEFKLFFDMIAKEGWIPAKKQEYGQLTGRRPRTLENWNVFIREGGLPRNIDKSTIKPVETPLATGIEENGTVRKQWKITDKEIRSLEELLEAFQVNSDVWKVKTWKCGFHQMGYVKRPNQSNKLSVEEGSQVPLWRAEATFEPQPKVIQDAFADARSIIQQASEYMPVFSGVVSHSREKREHAAEFSIPDLHFGKLAWGEETGSGNYDLNIAEALCMDAVQSFLNETAGYDLQEILFPLGNDLLNCDNSENTTTAGTPQSADGRQKKTFRRTREMISNILTVLAERAPVKVLTIPGNHDTASIYYLADSLQGWLQNHPNIEIDNNAYARKTWQFGANGIMFTHGSEKSVDLPITFAVDYPELWNATTFREVHCGHLHTRIVFDTRGVTVRFLASLSDSDYWHSSKNYKSRRSAHCFVYQRDGLMMREFLYNAEPSKVLG